jgi:hypothetical protein
MHARDLLFVIPTCRLREVATTIEQYDEHFWRNGHSVRMMVFDDGSPDNQQKYYALLEQSRTHNDVFYVGPREKEQFLAHLSLRLRDKRLDGLVKILFRPSYGGNRNFTLMYTLGSRRRQPEVSQNPARDRAFLDTASLGQAPHGERSAQDVAAEALDREPLMSFERDGGVEVEPVVLGSQLRFRRFLRLGAEELQPARTPRPRRWMRRSGSRRGRTPRESR